MKKFPMTEVISVGTNTIYQNVPRNRRSTFYSVVGFTLVAILFVSAALAIAIVYRGKQRSKVKQEQSYLGYKRYGRQARIQEYPFLAAVFSVKPHLFLCSAFILNERYLLTSANCFTTLFSNLMVRSGSSLCNEGGRLYEVDRFMVHEQYDSRNYKNNLAIIRTKVNIIFDNLTHGSNVYYGSDNPVEGANVILVGWGK